MKLKLKIYCTPLSIPFTKSVNTTWSKEKEQQYFIEIITNNNVRDMEK